MEVMLFKCISVDMKDKDAKKCVIEQDDNSLILRVKLSDGDNLLLFIKDYQKRGPYADGHVEYCYDVNKNVLMYNYKHDNFVFMSINKDKIENENSAIIATTEWVNTSNRFRIDSTKDNFFACVYAKKNLSRYNLDKFFEMVETTRNIKPTSFIKKYQYKTI